MLKRKRIRWDFFYKDPPENEFQKDFRREVLRRIDWKSEIHEYNSFTYSEPEELYKQRYRYFSLNEANTGSFFLRMRVLSDE